jgi:hypothetical protein
MAAPNFLSASLDSLTGSDNATGSLTCYFDIDMAKAPLEVISNYNFSPSLTIASASALARGPLAWYPTDDCTGSTVYNSGSGGTVLSGTLGDGAGSNEPVWPQSAWVVGKIDTYAINLGPRDGGYINAGNASNLSFGAGDDFSVACWVYATDPGNDWQGISYHGNEGEAQWTLGIQNGTKYLYGGTGDGVGWSTNISTTVVPTDAWTHCAVTLNRSTNIIKVYMNGSEVLSTSHTAVPSTTSTDARVGWGATTLSDEGLAGKIDDFGVWDVPLSASDIAILYNSGTGSVCSSVSSSNLALYYNMESGPGSSSVPDRSGNGNTGTLTNLQAGACGPLDYQTDDWVDYGTDAAWDIWTDPWTVSTWINPDALVGYGAIFGRTSASPGTSDYTFMCVMYPTGYIGIWAGGWKSGNTSGIIQTGVWQHITWVFDGTDTTYYYNGVSDGSDATSYSDNTARHVYTGQWLGNSYSFNGKIDNVSVFTEALDASSVLDLYNKGRNGDPNWYPNQSSLTVRGLDTAQGYILDVNGNIVDNSAGLSCSPNSASFVPAPGTNPTNVPTLVKSQGDGLNRTRIISRKSPGVISNFSAQAIRSTTTTTTVPLTVQYFQRVFDSGLSVYCYYTKTSIDPTPSAGETTPNYIGSISDHSVVKILEIY